MCYTNPKYNVNERSEHFHISSSLLEINQRFEKIGSATYIRVE
jgi:hypothetical protein